MGIVIATAEGFGRQVGGEIAVTGKLKELSCWPMPTRKIKLVLG